jgi:hypothetical protein
MSNSQSELRIATLPEEDARWVELFTSKVETGRADDVADAETRETLQGEFPRLKDFDVAWDETYI